MTRSEQPGYFPASDGTPLYGVCHSSTLQARAPILFAPALFEERKSAYRILHQLALHLAEQGHPVLRFDFRGSGESGGRLHERHWSDLCEDLKTAFEASAKMCDTARPHLLGLRMGATLCLQVGQELDAASIIALAPIPKGATQVRHWRLRSKMRAQLTTLEKPENTQADEPRKAETSSVDLDGYSVSPQFLEECQAIDLLKSKPLACPSLLAQIGPRKEASVEFQNLQEKLGPRCRLKNVRMEPFWERIDGVDMQPLIGGLDDFLEHPSI